MKKAYKYILYTLIVIAAIFFDQITKIVIENNFALGISKNIIPNFLRLTYIHNTGAAFGILSNKITYLVIFSILVIVFIGYQFYVYRKSTFICSSFALLLGGLIGNLIDRISFGYVRDFIDFQILKYDAPIFNVSDICITVSVLLIFLGIYHFEGVSKDVKPEDYSKYIRGKTGSVSNDEATDNEK